jgi:excisionase family DNA binding protein
MENVSMEELVSLKEAARLLEVSKAAVWQRIKLGRLAAWKRPMSKKLLVKREDIERLMRPEVYGGKGVACQD